MVATDTKKTKMKDSKNNSETPAPTVPAPTPVVKTENAEVLKTIQKRHVKSSKKKLAGQERAREMKEKGLGLFAKKKLSPELAKIVEAEYAPRTEVVKRIWSYIKANQLNKGRLIVPDEKLRSIFPTERCGNEFDMLRMSGWLSSQFVNEVADPTPEPPPVASVPAPKRRVKA